jgi:hypothetical protein
MFKHAYASHANGARGAIGTWIAWLACTCYRAAEWRIKTNENCWMAVYRYLRRYAVGGMFCSCGFQYVYAQVTIISRRYSSSSDEQYLLFMNRTSTKIF